MRSKATPMRIAFMGTPAFAVPTLDALAAAGHQIVAAYTQPPRPAGRGKAPRPSPVQARAEALGIPVRCPVTLRDAGEQAGFAALELDAAVVAAYGLILPPAILAAPRHGCLNVHGSLLPRWRGAAPVQRAILAGDRVTGVCIMDMEAGLDTGPTRACVEVAIDDMNAGTLTDRLAGEGARLMVQVLAAVSDHPATPQPGEGVTYAHKIDKAESRLDLSAPRDHVLRQVRAFAPAPGAFFELEGERYRLLAAEPAEGTGPAGATIDDRLTIACSDGAIRPLLIGRAGRPAMAPDALLRGRAIPAGTRLG